MRGAGVVLAAMRAHNDAELHVYGLKLFAKFSGSAHGWQTLTGGTMDYLDFFTEALHNNIAGIHLPALHDNVADMQLRVMQLRATRRLCEQMLTLSQETGVMGYLSGMHELPTVLVDVLRLMLANIETETAVVAIKNYHVIFSVSGLILRLCSHGLHLQFIRRFASIPGSIGVMLQALQYVHAISVAPPVALFTRTKHISHRTRFVPVHVLCDCIKSFTFVDDFSEHALQAGVILPVLDIMVETGNPTVRLSACRILADVMAGNEDAFHQFSQHDGVRKLAVMMRTLPPTERRFLFAVYHDILFVLAEYPAYKTAMLQEGYLQITLTHMQYIHDNNLPSTWAQRLHDLLQLHATI
jgi:hypothetical protein